MDIVRIESHQSIRGLLVNAGMESYRVQCMEILQTDWGNLSRIYFVREAQGNSYLKISGHSHSKGGFFIKCLGHGDHEERQAGFMRRQAVRTLLSKINGVTDRQIASQPLCFSPGLFEYWLPETEQAVMTRWTEVLGDHLEPIAPHLKRYDPISYDPSLIRMISVHLWQFQKLAAHALPEDPNLLLHEQRKLLGYPTVAARIRSALGVTEEQIERIGSKEEGSLVDIRQALRERAAMKADEIRDLCEALSNQLAVDGASDIQAVAAAFLSKYPPREPEKLKVAITSHAKGVPFQEALFYAERDQQWPAEVIRLGRRIAQIMAADEIVTDILCNEATLTLEFLIRLAQLEARYQRVDSFPKGVVLQDGHPLNFLKERETLAILDSEDISFDVAFVDLSNVYVYKIIRGFVDQQISRERCIELLQAILIPDWVGDHRPDILDYCIASFWNHSWDLAECYQLQPDAANQINLAVTLTTFMNELLKREQYDRVYRETFLESVMQS